MKNISILIVSILALLLLTSCGAKKYTVNLNPNAFHGSYLTDNAISVITPPIKFSRGSYIDKRSDKESFGASKNYIILTDNEFSDAFYDGLEAFLKSSNHSWENIEGIDVKIDVELLETQSKFIMGFWVIQFNSSVSTKISFIDLETEKTIYQQIYNGSSLIRSPAGHESMFKSVVNKSIVDCINKIGMDKKLYEALVKIKSAS